jgi:dynein heavy chain
MEVNGTAEEHTEDIVEPILVDWVKTCILEKLLYRDDPSKATDIQKFEELEKIWAKENKKATSAFLIRPHQQFLFICYEGDPKNLSTVKLLTTLKPIFPADCDMVLYMLKEAGRDVNINDVKDIVSFGIIEGTPLESLLSMMKNDFAPDILAKKTQWPDSMFEICIKCLIKLGLQKEFLSYLHKFLASLTETTFRMKGSTVLYVPLERIENVNEAKKQKDLCQRLECKKFD